MKKRDLSALMENQVSINQQCKLNTNLVISTIVDRCSLSENMFLNPNIPKIY